MSGSGKTSPLLWGILAGAVLAGIGGLAFTFLQAGKRAELKREGERLEAQWAILSRSQPAPIEENLAALRERRTTAEAAVESMVESLTASRDRLVPQTYGGAEELYFEIAALIENARVATAEAGVRVAPEEAFGFGAFVAAQKIPLPGAEGAPETVSLLDRIDQQRQALEWITRALWAAEPVSLVALERTPVSPLLQTEQLGDDLFTVDPLLTAAVPHAIETTGFRLTFTGKTSVLRAFLAAAAEWPVSIVVRSVEVEPLVDRSVTRNRPSASEATPQVQTADSPFSVFGVNPGASPSKKTAAKAADAPVPIVDANESRFTVVLEYYEVDLTPPPTEEEGWE